MNKKILIVEDNLPNMKLAADLLEYNGFEVMKAYNGNESLKLIKDATPELILLDLRLPDINGFEIFDKLRRNKRFDSTKIVAITAQATAEEKNKIEAYGFDGQIYKPIDTRKFIEQIKAFLNE